MERLVHADLGAGAWPAGWIEVERRWTAERGALRSHEAAVFQIVVAGGLREHLRFEMEVEIGTGANIGCGDGTTMMIVDLRRHEHRIIYSGIHQLANAKTYVAPQAGRYRVAFDFHGGHLSASVDEVEMISTEVEPPHVHGGAFELGFWDDCLVHSVSVYGSPSHEGVVIHEAKDFHLEVNVDFFDDLIPSAWSAEMLDQMFAEFRSWGVKRCHWIYYGRQEEGWWDDTPHGIASHAGQTHARIGEIFPAAVRAAHKAGVEIYGLIKPFDMGFHYSHTPPGKISYVGGRLGWIANFPAERRDLLMARKPGAYGPARNQVFTRIDLVKEDAHPADFGVEDVEIYTSTDNVTYQRYEGPIVRTEQVEDVALWEHTSSGGRFLEERRKSLVMRFSDLAIEAPYLVLSVKGRNGSFANIFGDLIHIYGPDGEERLLTYGVLQRAGEFEMGDNVCAVSLDSDFTKNGIHFDVADGSPSSINPGFDFVRSRQAFDAGEGVLAVAAGKERTTIAALSPSFPEVREWWMSWVRACLEAGADGVELRVRNHHTHLAWGEFGFEQPVRDAYLALYGVDIWQTDDFDKDAWRRLRGEAYTEFYREARKVVNSYGKPLGLHISHTNNSSPSVGGAMDIHWDWPTWLADGLADSVTMQDIWPQTRFAREILQHTRPRGLPVIFCPYANNLWLKPGGAEICAEWLRLAREGGFDGYQLYEAAGVLRAKAGSVEMTEPALREVFQGASETEAVL